MAETDPTETTRRDMIATGQPEADAIVALVTDEPTWDTDQLREEFEVLGYMAPFVAVRRRSDGQKGSLEFTHSPRLYFGFTPTVV